MAVIEYERHAASSAGSFAVGPTEHRQRAVVLTAAPGEALRRSAGDDPRLDHEVRSDHDLLHGFKAATTPVDPDRFID